MRRFGGGCFASWCLDGREQSERSDWGLKSQAIRGRVSWSYPPGFNQRSLAAFRSNLSGVFSNPATFGQENLLHNSFLLRSSGGGFRVNSIGKTSWPFFVGNAWGFFNSQFTRGVSWTRGTFIKKPYKTHGFWGGWPAKNWHLKFHICQSPVVTKNITSKKHAWTKNLLGNCYKNYNLKKPPPSFLVGRKKWKIHPWSFNGWFIWKATPFPREHPNSGEPIHFQVNQPLNLRGVGNSHRLRWWSQRVSCKFSSFVARCTRWKTTEKRKASQKHLKYSDLLEDVYISYWKWSRFQWILLGFQPGKVLFFVRHVSVSRGRSVDPRCGVCCCFFPFRLKPRLANGDKDWQNRNGQMFVWIPILWELFWKAFFGHSN